MADFLSSFASGLGRGLSSGLTKILFNGFNNKKDKDPNYYKKQQKAEQKMQNFVDKQNLAQSNLLKSISNSNDLLERSYDVNRDKQLGEAKKHLATIRAYAGLHGTGQTNAIRNQLDSVNQKTDDSLKNLKYNTENQINTNVNKFKNFINKQKLDLKGLLL